MKRLALIAVLLLTSCTTNFEEILPIGTYSAQVKNGTLSVELLGNGVCRVSITDGFDISDGTYYYSAGGEAIVIKAAVAQHYEYAKPGTTTEGWRNIYSFTGNGGRVTSSTSFTHAVTENAPLSDEKLIQLTFTKQ